MSIAVLQGKEVIMQEMIFKTTSVIKPQTKKLSEGGEWIFSSVDFMTECKILMNKKLVRVQSN